MKIEDKNMTTAVSTGALGSGSGRPLQILIDGLCPLCKWEGEFLRRLDRGRGRLAIVDLTAPEFDPAALGVTHEAIMGQIHAVAPDGSIVTGMEVFRRAYSAVGWGWLWAPTAWPVLRPIFDAMYRWFARNRTWLTGRPGDCVDGRCKV